MKCWVVIALGTALLSACGMVTNKQAAAEFQPAHPKASIYKQFVGEGDGDHVYMHYRHTENGKTNQMEQVWLYQRQTNGEWKVIHKDGPEPAGYWKDNL